jgi:hypothetical protein
LLSQRLARKMKVQALEFAVKRPLAGQMTPVPRPGGRSCRSAKGQAKRKGEARDGGSGIVE